MKKNVLVFPCGSEIGLEIHRSVMFSTYFNLIGASSVDDNGKFIYQNYIENIPFHNSPDFIPAIKKLVEELNIDAIYPTMDAVATTLKQIEQLIGCKVVGSSYETTLICNSKKDTYNLLLDVIPVPKFETSLDAVDEYPVFIKPETGYGSRNQLLAHTHESASVFLAGQKHETKFLFCEVLTGEEYTIDCFSNSKGELSFSGARKRNRVVNGISVNTFEDVEHAVELKKYAAIINEKMKPRGAWFFQMKASSSGELKLLEVAARFGGSSSLFRVKGINFALLTLFDSFGYTVDIIKNECDVILGRALNNKYKIDIKFSHVYVDFDDCILLGDKLNVQLMAFLFKCLNEKIGITLITRHKLDIYKTLQQYKLAQIFDEVIHLQGGEKKSKYLQIKDSIFIDDSFAERLDVKKQTNIPVFSPDMIEVFI